MTVAVDDRRREYPGNGVTTAFNGPMAYSADVVFVYLVDDVTRAVVPVATSGFTLERVGREGGTRVVMVVPPPVGQTLLILRTVPYSQLTDITNQSAFNADVLERGMDLLGMQNQQLADGINRSLRVSDTIVGFSAEITDPVPLSPVVINALGNGFEAGSTALTGDMLLRPNLATNDAGKGSDLVAFRATDPLAAAITLTRVNTNAIPVTWYAEDAVLAVDATDALQKAIDWAESTGIRQVYFPAGRTYRFAAASASIDPGVGDMSFFGDGIGSVIIFEEGTATGSILLRKNLFRNTTNTAKGKLRFDGLQFQGTWSQAGYPTGQGGATMLLDYYDEITITNCLFTNLRSYVMVNEFCGHARVMNCTFDKNARDNVRFRSTFNVQVIGNRFSHCDDDAVALHSNIGSVGGDIREGIIVSGNLFEDCPAVQIIGGRMVSVTDNILRRCKQNGILVYTAVGVANEGDNGMFAVTVSDNQIFDMLNDGPFATPASQVIGVYARAAEGGSSTGGIIPGQNNVATGAFPLPWNSRNTAYTGAVDSVAPLFFVRIQNNTIIRTLPAVANYSLWGYGESYAGDGPQDPAVVDASQRPGTGIIIGGQVRKAIISGNVVSHVGSCVGADSEAGSNFGLDDVLVTNNVFSDFNASAVNIPNPGAARHINLDIRHNLMDGDPYHISANRGTLGTWLADTTPTVVNCTSHQGVRLEGNKIRNVARIVNNGGGSLVAVKDNVLRCDPAATGFSTSNKGIGNCPRADDAYRYEITDSDPTSATYGNITSAIQMFSAAMPATGKYVAGTFIRASSGTTLLGWQRLTTGTAHVAGTDWKTVVLT